MEFIIEKEEMLRGLSRIQNVVEKKIAMPILSNALIECKGEEISITATDLEIGLQGFYRAKVLEEGRFTVSAKKLFEVVKELPEKEVIFRSSQNQWIEVICGKANFKIMGLSAETFPSLPAYEEEGFFTIRGKIFREMIERTIYAVSMDESRYNLRGHFLAQWRKENDQGLRMVTTDGYRISIIDRGLAGEIKGLEKGILLPKKGMSELNRLISENGENIEVKLKNNNFIVRLENVILIMRLLDAEFPDYQQVIPKKTKRKVRIKREILLNSLKRVSLFASEKTRGVKFHFGQGFLELTSYSPEIGEAKEEISIDFRGEDLIVGFNARFILEILSSFYSEEVDLEMEDERSPAILRPTNDIQHTCVIMPMRI